MSVVPTPTMFSSFATYVEAVLAQADISIAGAHNFYTLGTRAYVDMGTGYDAQNRLCAVVYRVEADDLDQAPARDAPAEYKALLECAGYVVHASQVPAGWAAWAVYPPPDALVP